MANIQNDTLVSTFLLGKTVWGINTLEVQEVIRVPEITKVNNSQYYIVGIINLRGKIVTVIDVSKKLGLEEVTISELNRIIIVELDGEYIGLLIDSISDIINIDMNLLTVAPSTMYGTRGEYIDSVYQTDEQLIPILNIKEVLAVTDDWSE